jgi:hypothetical protein
MLNSSVNKDKKFNYKLRNLFKPFIYFQYLIAKTLNKNNQEGPLEILQLMNM